MKIDLSEHHSRLKDNRSSIIVSKDERAQAEHRAQNRDKDLVRHFKIDGEVLPKGQQPKRCDFLLLNDDKKNAYYIELKGSDVKEAVSQILATEQYCRRSLSQYRAFYRVIYRSSTHELRGQEALNLKTMCMGRLVIKSRQYSEDI